MEKARVVETLEYMHERAGLDIVDEDGTNLLGGHSLRLAGARLLTAAGLHVYQVELMARWNSPMLLHYARAAPLTKVTQEYENAIHRNSITAALDQLRQQMQDLRNDQGERPRRDNSVTDRMTVIENRLQVLDEFTRRLVQSELEQVKLQLLDKPAEFIKNTITGTWHKAAVDGLGHPPSRWKTRCGWPFGLNEFCRNSKLPSNLIKKCDRCFSFEQDAQARQNDIDESDSC